MRKPDPAIYHHACTLIGTDPAETLFLDDSAAMAAGAEAAGLRALHVTDHAAAVAEVHRLLDLPTP
jgi:HAD superfamily hydrolase (TIGR01509 family)